MRINRLLQPIALATLLFAGTGAVNAQTVGLNWNPRTGDVWVDTQLADINRYGSSYREPFIDEMVRYHGSPRDLVTDLLVNERWSAGDVYYACTLAQAVGRPCRYVADQWQENRSQGWGALAQRLGIKPGSAEFHRLKKGFVPTYDRWSRPIDLDGELTRAYPNRSKGKAKTAVSAKKQTEGKSAGKMHAGKEHAGKQHAGMAPAAASSKAKGSSSAKTGKVGSNQKSGKAGGHGKGDGKGNGKP